MPKTTTDEAPPTVADLIRRLGGIPANRIWLRPAPGTAKERDVLRVHDHEGRLCELVDGVLVEKAMGFSESRLAIVLAHLLETFLDGHDLGIVAGEAGMLRLEPGMVRIPDVSFVSWSRLPGRQLPERPIPDLVPDLAVEVLSAGNTAREMRRKVGEYFAKGVRLVWLVEPRTRTIQVCTSPEDSVRLGEKDTLTGGEVLPGFKLSVRELFERASRTGPRK